MYRSGEGPLDGMIESLFQEAEVPPKEVKGVSQGFLDGECDCPDSGVFEVAEIVADHFREVELERVPRKVLKKDMDCPICGNPFLEGEGPYGSCIIYGH